MTSPTWNFDKMLKGLPNINTVSRASDQIVSWHMFDISRNYMNERINWADNVIELKDSKQLICYSFTYYLGFKAYTPIADIMASNGGIIDIDGIRTYFRDCAFSQIFNGIETDVEVVDMCGLTPESFIIMPIYESAQVMYVALLNINKAYGEYMGTIYNINCNNSAHCFFNLADVTHGLQNHTNITGVKQATSFNLFKSLYTSNAAKYNKKGLNYKIGLNYKFDGTKLMLNDNCEIPIILLFNGYNYFPRLQVVWSTDKIFLNLPGVMPPNNDSLLSSNKVLKATDATNTKSTDKCEDSSKIPRVMSHNTITTKSKQKPVTEWLRDYKKYCGCETTQYTSMTKLLCSMNRLKLEVPWSLNFDYDSTVPKK